jgi:hypothetical protein
MNKQVYGTFELIVRSIDGVVLGEREMLNSIFDDVISALKLDVRTFDMNIQIHMIIEVSF